MCFRATGEGTKATSSGRRGLAVLSLLALGALLLAGCSGRNEPPSARILEPANGARLVERTVTFKAEVSDPEDRIESLLWNFGDGQQQAGEAEISHTYARGGTFTVRLTVTDDAEQSATAAVRLVINQEPVAVARAQLQRGDEVLPFVKVIDGIAPLTVQFEGSRSYDPDGDLQSLHWAFGDGADSDEPDPVHTYQEPGEYEAVLTVTDADGATAQDRVRVRLQARPLRVSDVLETEEPVPAYRLIKGSTAAASGSALYQYHLEDPGPFDAEQIRLALLDALTQLALQAPELSQITVYLFTEPKPGFMDPGDYDHYLGMAQWERPQEGLRGNDLVRHVVQTAQVTLNEKYLDGTALRVVGYKLFTSPLDPDDPRCGQLCTPEAPLIYVSLILNPLPEAVEAPPPEPLCRQVAQTTIQQVLQRALGARGGYGLNIYEGSVGVPNGIAVGLWAVGVDPAAIQAPGLIFTVPETWQIDSGDLRLSFVRELPDCE